MLIPNKRGLVGYLVMAAHGDLLNALAKARRRREDLVDDVELQDLGGKSGSEKVEARMYLERIRPELERLLPDPADRRAVEAMLDDERATAEFVEIWRLEDLSPDEQRKEVKRGKDRLKKALKRLGQQLREREG